MTFSEKTARQISKYIVKLVQRQKYWLRKLFDDDLICFSVEDDGSIVLCIAEQVPPRVKATAQRTIAKYMEMHPNDAIGGLKIT